MTTTKSRNNNMFEGLAVVDARRPLTVTVTKDDIRISKRKTNSVCAFAVAVQREYGAKEVRVHLARTYIKAATKNLWVRYSTPAALRSEVIAFDRGGEFMPERFTLLVPPKDNYTKRVVREKKRRRAGGALRAVILQKQRYVLKGVRVRHNNGTDKSGRPRSMYDRRYAKPVLRSGKSPPQL